MSSEIEELETKLAELDNYLAWVRKTREDLSERSRSLKSKEFIRVNRITKSQVQDDRADDVPWFGHAIEFSKWLKSTGCTKPWCVWNERVHRTSDFIAGTVRLDESVARYEDVPE